MSKMTRGELAKRTGVSSATIRYYEDIGLLPVPGRTASGYCIYSDDYLVKIKFIRDAKALGYSLKEIEEALQLLDQDMTPDRIDPKTLFYYLHVLIWYWITLFYLITKQEIQCWRWKGLM